MGILWFRVDQNACPICSYGPQRVETADHGEQLRLRCPWCGEFTITRTVAGTLEERGLAAKLSAWIRSRSERGAKIPVISTSNLQEIIDNFPDMSVVDKQVMLLEIFGRRSKHPGFSVPFESSLDFPLIWGENASELEFHLRALIERFLVQAGDQQKAATGHGPPEYILTPAGWTHLEETNRPRSIREALIN